MSWQATSWVIEHSKHKGSALLTLLCIANCANGDGSYARPGMSRLARDTRMSRSQVLRIIQKLEASGELTVKRTEGVENTYSFSALTRSKMRRVTGSATSSVAMTPTSSIAMTPDPKDSNNLNTPSLSPSRSYQSKSKPPKPPPEPRISCPENILTLAGELRELYEAPGRDLDAIAVKWFHYWSGQTRSKFRTLEEWTHCFQYWMQDEKNSGNGKQNGKYESASERNVRYIRESLAEFDGGLPSFPEDGDYQGAALLLAAGTKSR